MKTLFYYAQNDDAKNAELCLKQGADPNASTNGWKPLHVAAENLHVDVVDVLLANGADPNLLGPNGESPLRQLLRIAKGLPLDVELTVKRNGKDVVITDPEEIDRITGNKHATAQRRALAIAKRLLDAGSDVSVPGRDTYTPALFATQSNCKEILVLICAAESFDPAGTDSTGMTALHMAVRNRNVDTVRMLLEAGVPVNHAESYGYTALHEAASLRHLEIVQLLLDAGADRTSKTKQSDSGIPAGSTPHDIAKLRRTKELAALLE
jgi:ankyrin repeat protein